MEASYQINPEQERASRAVLGLPVISIQESLMLGYIKQILIDGQDRLVQAFVVERRRLGKEDRVLPFAAVSGFGEDSITIDKMTLLERKGLSHQYVRALRRPLPILGARVFTDSGKTLGKVEEYRFSILDGKISGLEVAGSGLFKDRSLLHGQYVIAISPQTVMVKDAAIANAVTVENPFLSNMESAAETVKEKATDLSNSAREATKKFSASFNGTMNRLRNREDNEEGIPSPQASDVPDLVENEEIAQAEVVEMYPVGEHIPVDDQEQAAPAERQAPTGKAAAAESQQDATGPDAAEEEEPADDAVRDNVGKQA
jgi:uncharacterized protein YrrD